MSAIAAFRRLHLNVSGIAAVEFAFVAPLMMAFLLGMIELGRLFLIHNALTFATDEAARAAMIHQTISSAELETLARSYAVGLDADLTTVTVTVQNYADGRLTNVSISYQFRLMTSFFSLGEFTMERSARVNRRQSF